MSAYCTQQRMSFCLPGNAKNTCRELCAPPPNNQITGLDNRQRAWKMGGGASRGPIVTQSASSQPVVLTGFQLAIATFGRRAVVLKAMRYLLGESQPYFSASNVSTPVDHGCNEGFCSLTTFPSAPACLPACLGVS